MIKKVWAKFDGMDLECVCDEHHKKCTKETDCKEYVVKFVEIDRTPEEEIMKHLANETNHLRREINKFQSRVSKSIRKFKI